MARIEGSQGRGPATASFEYNFATHGGAIGAITLSQESGVIPDNAVITGAYLEAVSSLTSGGAATVKLGITGNDNSFQAATAFNDAAYVAEAATSVGAELPLKVNSGTGVAVLATVATAALTAGRFRVHVEWVPGA